MSSNADASRGTKDLRPADAQALIAAAQDSLDEAAAITSGWTRRRLLDVALTLAAQADVPHPEWTDWQLRNAHAAFLAGSRHTQVIRMEETFQARKVRRLASTVPVRQKSARDWQALLPTEPSEVIAERRRRLIDAFRKDAS